jgi:ATP-dependent Clp protease ATP-binding subunit ClpA
MTMFERFSDEARTVVTQAVVEAKEAHAVRVGTQHLLLAMLARPDSASGRALRTQGLDLARARSVLAGLESRLPVDDLDPDALRAIGIDLDSVRASVEATFGEGTLDVPAGQGVRRRLGHLPFSPRSKKTLELSLREAIRLRQSFIGDAHILLGILREGDGLAAQVLHEAGVDLPTLRTDLEAELRRAG